MDRQKIHIGKLIEQKFKASGMSKKDFADKIPCTYSNVYNIFDSEDIYLKRLIRISEILQFDFIKYLAELNELENQGQYVVNTTNTNIDTTMF
ncbi:MAG: XRE family transcriptional regulator [Bacteroidales bacterium]|jgi:predicted transcriptional regulator|nr:XRE family transcriptional regulator [Bacteroidales bacterium]